MIQGIKDTARLNNGLNMPWLGFGVFKVPEGEVAVQAVKDALAAGYRSIDTAALYRNERSVGIALRESGLPREEIFLTTKLSNQDQRAGRYLQAFDESLERLGLDYVDLYLIHWPVVGSYKAAWKALHQVQQSGRARAIGVSNFMVHHLKDILADGPTLPAVNQVEFHPYLFLPDLLEFCKAHDIQLEAWSPLAKGQVAADPRIQKLAEKYQRTPAQIVLRWDLQHGIVTIPKSTHAERIAENTRIFDFELSAADMQALDAMNEGRRTGPDPDNVNF